MKTTTRVKTNLTIINIKKFQYQPSMLHVYKRKVRANRLAIHTRTRKKYHCYVPIIPNMSDYKEVDATKFLDIACSLAGIVGLYLSYLIFVN